MNNKSLNILWLANFPKEEFSGSHPVPWTKQLAQELSKHSTISLTILTRGSDNYKYYDEENKLNVIWVKKPPKMMDLLTFKLLSIFLVRLKLKRIYKNFDLIHIHGTEHLYHVAATSIDIPKVISIQGLKSIYYKYVPYNYLSLKISWYIDGLYELIFLKGYRNFMCRTHWDSGFIFTHVPNCRVFKIWEMIRPQFYTNQYVYKSNQLGISFMGGSWVLKGFNEFMQAVNILHKTKDLPIYIMGKFQTNDYINVKKRYKLLNIKDELINFLGVSDADEIIKVYNKSICIVHPSHIDNSPNTICEAQLIGLPVIASNVGGVSSLIEDGKTGLLTDLNPNNIVEKITTLYSDPKLRNHISQHAKEVATKRHEKNEIIRDTLNCYKTIIE